MTITATPLSTGHTFLEGPRWHNGDLYVSDFFTEAVLRFTSGTGEFHTVCTVPGRPSGLGFLPSGDLLAVSMLEQRIMHFDGTRLSEYANLGDLVRGPLNDMLVDPMGRCYVGGFGHSATTESDFAGTALLLVDEHGQARVAADDLNFPNGMVLTDAGATLLVAETYAARISAFAVAPDGTLTDRRPWKVFGEEIEYFDVERAHHESSVEPDGLAIDVDGNVWVADAKGRGVTLLDSSGTPLEFVDTGSLSAYAAAVGGPDGRTLYICCAPENRSVDYPNLTSSVLMSARIG